MIDESWSAEAKSFVELISQKANIKSADLEVHEGIETQLRCSFSIDPENEKWWRSAATTIRLEELEASWSAFFGTEYVLDTKTGGGDLQLGYTWLLILIHDEGLSAALSHLRNEILVAAQTSALRRVPVDVIRVGPPDRNVPRGVSKFGNKPNPKGAVKGVAL